MKTAIKRPTVSRLELLALAAILVLAAALRLGWPGVNSFGFDEAYVSAASLNMARSGQLATLGMPSSVGVPNFPAAIWLFSLPYLVSTNPLFASGLLGVLSVLTVAGVWAMGRRHWGSLAGLVAALYLAANPYSVLYARSVWAQDLLPILAFGWLWTGYRAASNGGSGWIVAHVFIAFFAVQVHFAGIALAIGTLWLVVRRRWWRRPLPVLIGGALALLAALPTLLRAIFTDPQLFGQFRHIFAGQSQLDLIALGQLISVGTGHAWGYLALGDLDTFSGSWLPGLIIGTLLIVGLVVLKRALRENWRRPLNTALLAELLLLCMLVPALWLVRHTVPALIHYQLIALPALALTIGASVNAVRRRWWPFVNIALMVVVSLVWTLQIAYSLNTAGSVETPNGLGTPLSITQNVARIAGANVPVLLFTHGDNPAADGEPAVFDALWWGHPHRIINGENQVILPNSPAWLVATLAPFQAWEDLQAAGLTDASLTLPRRTGADSFEAVYYDGKAAPQGFTPVQPIPFKDGLTLEGWRARRVGPRLRISTLWRVESLAVPGTYQQFQHLRTRSTLDGDPFKGADVPLAAQKWQIGDQLIVMADFFPETADTFWVDVGHYTLSDMQRIPLADGSADKVRLGPFEWK